MPNCFISTVLGSLCHLNASRTLRVDDIKIDGSPATVDQLASGDGIKDVFPDLLIDDEVIRETRKSAEYLRSEVSILEMDKLQQQLRIIYNRISVALNEIEDYAGQIGLEYDRSQRAVAQLTILATIAAKAPTDLLHYRRHTLSKIQALDILAKAEEAHKSESFQRNQLAENFYLDSVPSEQDLKTAITVFRRGDSLLNIFSREWRAAKTLVKSFSRKNEKKKATDYETDLSNVLRWKKDRLSFIENDDFRETFGTLFKGLETDFSKISRLCRWYADSQAEMLRYPGFIESIDLSAIDERKILQLSTLSPRLQVISDELDFCRSQIRQILGADFDYLEIELQHGGWQHYNDSILHVINELKSFVVFLSRYVKQHLSPKRAVALLEARREFQSVSSDLETLKRGVETIRMSLHPILPGIISIPCTQWGDYLVEISRLANSAKELAQFTSEYSGDEHTIADIRRLFESKIAVDSSVAKLAAARDETAAIDWASYIDIPKRQSRAAADILRVLKPCGKLGASSKDVLDGWSLNGKLTASSTG